LTWLEFIELLAAFIPLITFFYHIIRRSGILNKINKILKIIKKSGIIDISPKQTPLAQNIVEEFRKAKEIKLLFVRGLGIIGLKDSLFWKLLPEKSAQQAHLKILLLSPYSKYIEKRAKEVGENIESARRGIQFVINQILEAKKRYSLNLELRVYDELPVFRIFILDDKAFISGFLDGIHGHDATMYFIKSSELSLFDFF
jgi:hypothetical protein